MGKMQEEKTEELRQILPKLEENDGKKYTYSFYFETFKHLQFFKPKTNY